MNPMALNKSMQYVKWQVVYMLACFCMILSIPNIPVASPLPADQFGTSVVAAPISSNRRGGSDHGISTNNDFAIISDRVIHDGWRKLVRRTVTLPSSLQVEFEIVGQRGTDQAVLVFVWHSRTKTVTLIREYMPALHKRVLGLAAGMVEDSKHATQDARHDASLHGSSSNCDKDRSLTAAEYELEEECRMKGGTWYRVTEHDSAMDKYCTTRLGVYLVIDPEPVAVEHALPRDETEEGMEVVTGTTIPELMELIASGQLTVVGGWASLLAIHKLRELGEIN
ncbi:hypothetical protein MPSEU_001072500 [Mayamaea pseudoterrestris]|nr:hypothetical protein MPSEU_001072500 [Mayamaea pseudoterrestris]